MINGLIRDACPTDYGPDNVPYPKIYEFCMNAPDSFVFMADDDFMQDFNYFAQIVLKGWIDKYQEKYQFSHPCVIYTPNKKVMILKIGMREREEENK